MQNFQENYVKSHNSRTLGHVLQLDTSNI